MRTSSIRIRSADDLPALIEMLGRQQAESRYPMRWPLPFPVQDFLVRETEVAAWVVEVDGALGGHVSVCLVPPGVVADGYRTALGAPAMDGLRLISVLLVDDRLRGSGLGRVLLDHAVAWIRTHDLQPALDVLPVHGAALRLYERSGWVGVGDVRPEWLPDGEPDMTLMLLPPESSA